MSDIPPGIDGPVTVTRVVGEWLQVTKRDAAGTVTVRRFRAGSPEWEAHLAEMHERFQRWAESVVQPLLEWERGLEEGEEWKR